MAACLQTTVDVPSRKQFDPRETLDHPFDITLVAEDGKEFKAHRRVLSEASPFFEKLLNSDMRKSNEGVVRLEMLTELCVGDILEFIYTGSVQISAEQNAQELIAMPDYLVLPHLKTLAEKYLLKNLKLNDSNAISTYYFAERYRCEDLMCVSKDFIVTNFTAVSKTEGFLNLSSNEVKMWISSDEIDVNAEEDVFTLILTWSDREKSERKKYFAELFCKVRLVYVSRDYLLSDIVTNDLVNDNEGCLDLVKDAMKFFDAKKCHLLSVKPRYSLTTPVIVFHLISEQEDRVLVCYSPRKNSWSRFYGPAVPECGDGKVIRCHGELYFIPDVSYYERHTYDPLRYDEYSNCWKSIPYVEQRIIRKAFVRNDHEIYVLSVSKLNGRTCWGEYECVQFGHCEHVYFISKYKPESNSWEDVTSFDMGSRVMICAVAKDNFIYFLGGLAQSGDKLKALSDVDRYDLSTNTWDKIANFNEPRCNAYGAVAYGKILIAGGANRENADREIVDVKTCEVYNEAANEWHIIQPSSLKKRKIIPIRVCADGTLFVLQASFINSRSSNDTVLKCYDADSSSWKEITQIPLEKLFEGSPMSRYYRVHCTCSSMRVLETHGFFEALLSEECSTRSHKRRLNVGKCKCTIT